MGLLAIVLNVLAAVAAGVPQAPATGATTGDDPGFLCDAVRVSGAPPSRQVQSPVFSSRTTPDIELRPRLKLALRGAHVVRLKVFTPRGFLYQEITVPLAAPPALDASTGAVPARDAVTPAHDPGKGVAPVRDPSAPSGTPAAVRGPQARLPVAGTSITQSSIFGSWSVQPYLDDQPTPCGPATSFTITE